jgi:uncharacterized membrane protein YwaF
MGVHLPTFLFREFPYAIPTPWVRLRKVESILWRTIYEKISAKQSTPLHLIDHRE